MPATTDLLVGARFFHELITSPLQRIPPARLGCQLPLDSLQLRERFIHAPLNLVEPLLGGGVGLH
jgi:hypothetical protein